MKRKQKKGILLDTSNLEFIGSLADPQILNLFLNKINDIDPQKIFEIKIIENDTDLEMVVGYGNDIVFMDEDVDEMCKSLKLFEIVPPPEVN